MERRRIESLGPRRANWRELSVRRRGDERNCALERPEAPTRSAPESLLCTAASINVIAPMVGSPILATMSYHARRMPPEAPPRPHHWSASLVLATSARQLNTAAHQRDWRCQRLRHFWSRISRQDGTGGRKVGMREPPHLICRQGKLSLATQRHGGRRAARC